MTPRAALGLLLLFSACRPAKQAPPISRVVLATDAASPRILRGVFAQGEGGWRWTAATFAFSLDRPAADKPVYLELEFDVPEELNGPANVVAKVNGNEVARKSCAKGRQILAALVPPDALTRQPAEVEFTADRSFRDGATGNPYSLIVFSAGLKEREQTAEFRDEELARARTAYEDVLKQRNLQLPVEKQREIMRLFHELPIWNSLWFQNVRIIKNPLDLWMLQQTAYEMRPDFIVETGTWQGGSALWWAHTLTGMGLDHARVLTVDLQDLTKTAAAHPLWMKHVEFVQGSSTDPKIVAKFAERVRGRRVLVNLDSDHSMQHVLNELRLYAPMVGPGGYIAVEDTHLDGIPTHPEQGPGPTAAIRQFLAEPAGKDFEQDFTREALVMTSYPGGWLRRKKQP
jgi:cephalosporin hydroxylase